MAQSANLELVENLRPFIAKMVQQALAQQLVVMSGNNISINQSGVVSLSDNVEIENVLRIGQDGTFQLWDELNEVYRGLNISTENGNPVLVFSTVDNSELDTIGEENPSTNSLTAGENITISEGKIHLSIDVEISKTLRISKYAMFELWDDYSQEYRSVRISVINGEPILEFGNSSGWEGIL